MHCTHQALIAIVAVASSLAAPISTTDSASFRVLRGHNNARAPFSSPAIPELHLSPSYPPNQDCTYAARFGTLTWGDDNLAHAPIQCNASGTLSWYLWAVDISTGRELAFTELTGGALLSSVFRMPDGLVGIAAGVDLKFLDPKTLAVVDTAPGLFTASTTYTLGFVTGTQGPNQVYTISRDARPTGYYNHACTINAPGSVPVISDCESHDDDSSTGISSSGHFSYNNPSRTAITVYTLPFVPSTSARQLALTAVRGPWQLASDKADNVYVLNYTETACCGTRKSAISAFAFNGDLLWTLPVGTFPDSEDAMLLLNDAENMLVLVTLRFIFVVSTAGEDLQTITMESFGVNQCQAHSIGNSNPMLLSNDWLGLACSTERDVVLPDYPELRILDLSAKGELRSTYTSTVRPVKSFLLDSTLPPSSVLVYGGAPLSLSSAKLIAVNSTLQ